MKLEDSSVLWQEIHGLKQKDGQNVEVFMQEFSKLWNCWCVSLGSEISPVMLKKNMFIASLARDLWLKVDLKRPRTFEDAECTS